jgi:hypothetical protein
MKKQTQVSPFMQDLFILSVGILILISAFFIEEDTLPFYLFLAAGIALSVGGVCLAVFTVLKAVLTTLYSGFRTLYGIRVDAKQDGWLMSIVVREIQEIRGVPLLFILFILLIGFMLGLLF